jgi:hypothetical protein
MASGAGSRIYPAQDSILWREYLWLWLVEFRMRTEHHGSTFIASCSCRISAELSWFLAVLPRKQRHFNIKEKCILCMTALFSIAYSSTFLGVSVFLVRPIELWGSRWRSSLRHYAISQKVVGSIPDKPLKFSVDLNLLAALWPRGFYSASNINEYQEYF